MRFVKRAVIGWFVVVFAAVAGAFTVKKAVPAFGDEGDDWFSLVAVAGGKTFDSGAERFAEGSALAVMGGINLDLRGATLAPGAKLNLRAFMGGIEVTVPPSWRVEVVATERMGEVVNELVALDQGDEAPLLIVYATATMGGISIRGPQDS